MIVLGIRERERIRAEALAEVSEADTNHLMATTLFSAFQKVCSVSRDALADHLIGKTKLIVEFKSPCLNRHGPRMFARSFGIRNEPERHTPASQAQRQIQPSRSGSNDQDSSLLHNTMTPGTAVTSMAQR